MTLFPPLKRPQNIHSNIFALLSTESCAIVLHPHTTTCGYGITEHRHVFSSYHKTLSTAPNVNLTSTSSILELAEKVYE